MSKFGKLFGFQCKRFGSPSMAAVALLGRTANGWMEWKDASGHAAQAQAVGYIKLRIGLPDRRRAAKPILRHVQLDEQRPMVAVGRPVAVGADLDASKMRKPRLRDEAVVDVERG